MIEIKRWDTGEIIHSGDFKSVKECLEDGVKKHIDFFRANLWGAKLQYAKLQHAKLQHAYLQYADLQYADLRNAYLQYVDLHGAVGNSLEIKSMQIDTYTIAYTKNDLQIGCERYPIEKWWLFTDDEISEMDDGALEWWKKWKDVLKKIIEMSPAE